MIMKNWEFIKSFYVLYKPLNLVLQTQYTHKHTNITTIVRAKREEREQWIKKQIYKI
jgi:hypothetical protein